MNREDKWAVNYNLPKDWIVGLRGEDVVIGRAMLSEIFEHIWRISECGSKLGLEIRGAGAFVLRIKSFQKLSLETIKN